MEVPQVPPTEELSFRVPLHTRWSDEDNQSVLNNAVQLTLLEEGRYAYFSSLDLVEENRFPFLLMQCNARFLRPGRGGETMELEMGTTRLGTSSFEQAYRLRDARGQVVMEAVALLVCYDTTSGESRPMEPTFRARIAAREGLE